jgi:hypothetical protein
MCFICQDNAGTFTNMTLQNSATNAPELAVVPQVMEQCAQHMHAPLDAWLCDSLELGH